MFTGFNDGKSKVLLIAMRSFVPFSSILKVVFEISSDLHASG